MPQGSPFDSEDLAVFSAAASLDRSDRRTVRDILSVCGLSPESVAVLAGPPSALLAPGEIAPPWLDRPQRLREWHRLAKVGAFGRDSLTIDSAAMRRDAGAGVALLRVRWSSGDEDLFAVRH